ncbi:cytochrome c oxidase subunit 2, putative [Plasmodium berghei]|uniref:Cytochrome c oxidase subunit 2, putative n=2 Tax=Plasmodium berghei TaxID=5821 RepID=A0A509AL48_PLABA|nr:cytochrome c oxidase subunit 2, putative [Plasmodium berghei ANKA]CXI68124.1 cytochrome c oxidase subunit 2, putative [Plasmodium berghei]SCM24181.1 cytochrome c oxidase subunit 2, putative [Plasmodium berghei]SCN26967.1 cytochrome c oxidase subunit 2, putative [Plasmodium berghei]SCO61411.1 cytochrome c oxidase subunit 2, putative [Plasmodium berghei]SCO63388.1 cytochrome c oxidase subunit 2, putative [Plasmodium berghei]|eukprot:XP_034422583.1 cytochrome c oxidase subunit 2, putative [Plasmodium berghei ANKA]
MFNLNSKLYFGLRNINQLTSNHKIYYAHVKRIAKFPFKYNEFTTTKKDITNKVKDIHDKSYAETNNHGHAEHTKGLYHHVDHHHGNPHDHLTEDGTRKPEYDFDNYHWDDYWANAPKQNIIIVNGQKMIKGEETKPMEYLFNVSQQNIPFWSRTRLNVWGNHNLVLKVEFLFFWIPTLIIFSIAIPCFTMLYMLDEIVHTTMTVKVIGRQWYWIYEVESPPEDEE